MSEQWHAYGGPAYPNGNSPYGDAPYGDAPYSHANGDGSAYRDGSGRWMGGRGGGGPVIAGETVHVPGPPPWQPGDPAHGPAPVPPSPGQLRAAAGESAPYAPPPPGRRVPYGGYGDASPYDPRRRTRRTKRRRPVRRALLVLLAVLVATPVSTVAWAGTELNSDVDLAAAGAQRAAGKGTNYLIVGSDSRAGLSDRDKDDLHTGTAGGRRTDSMILLHTGAHGTTMMSLPRDSWVTVPGFTSPRTGKRHGPTKNKLNAAFAMGGPKMLARTVEHNTGLRVDHYAEIGFAGFVGLVDAVGGVRMCLDRDIKDPKSGADLRKGCQTLDGKSALAFVRQRHQEKDGDLGRTRNQQKFLSALADQAARPDTVLNPSELYPALRAGLDTLRVDQDTGLRELATLLRSVQGVTGGNGKQINVPTGRGISTSKGSAVTWDRPRAQRLFAQLRDDRPVR